MATNLNKAKKAKNDEFYTQLTDIEKELKHYKEHFKDKVVYCNCDDPRVSNFFRFFSLKFEDWGLKRLISTCYKSQDIEAYSKNQFEQAVYLRYEGDKNGNRMPDLEEITIDYMKGDGDFRSEGSIELLKQADIVVTNPPFSLFREYVAQLMEYDKKFLIIGNQNSFTCKDIFSLLKENKMWIGYNNPKKFIVPDTYEQKEVDENGVNWRSLGNICWYTNLDISKHNEELVLYRIYEPQTYPKYDNYDAINVDKVKEIPKDYDGVIGVPITFLDKYNPNQFEIIGIDRYMVDNPHYGKRFTIQGKEIYARILIKNRRINNGN